MSRNTSIEWCDATFNIAWGCIEYGEDCTNCYARELSKRYGHNVWGPAKTTGRRTFGEKHWQEPLEWNDEAKAGGRRRRVFCSSMADVFEDHPTIDQERTEKLWPLIRGTPWLDWLLLTKRTARIASCLPDNWAEGYPNVWLGASVGNQKTANERLPAFLRVPAWVHFVSYGPAIGPVDFTRIEENETGTPCEYNTLMPPTLFDELSWPGREYRIDWVVAEGESGFKARPCDLDWLRKTRDDCARHDVRFLLKQLGGVGVTKKAVGGGEYALLDGQRHLEWPDSHPELVAA